MAVENIGSTPSRYATNARISEERREFRETLQGRDVCCIMTGIQHYQAHHIIAYGHENEVSRHPTCIVMQHILIPFQWINVIVQNRPNNNEEVTGLVVNDVRNGVLVSPNTHVLMEKRTCALLKVIVFATDRYI